MPISFQYPAGNAAHRLKDWRAWQPWWLLRRRPLMPSPPLLAELFPHGSAGVSWETVPGSLNLEKTGISKHIRIKGHHLVKGEGWKCEESKIAWKNTGTVVGRQVNKERMWKCEQTQQWRSFQNKDGLMNAWETKEQRRLTFPAATFSTHTSHRLISAGSHSKHEPFRGGGQCISDWGLW